MASPYHVVSDEEDRIQAIVERVSAIREFWEGWAKAREDMACGLGLDDKAFIIRDLVEEALDLPMWTVMVQPTHAGWDLVVDLKYAERHRELDDEQWFNMCGGFIRAELQGIGGESCFRIYSAPIYFRPVLGQNNGKNS